MGLRQIDHEVFSMTSFPKIQNCKKALLCPTNDNHNNASAETYEVQLHE